jgi:acyl-CoA dehydrogenase
VIDFELDSELLALPDRVRNFVHEVVIPAESRDQSILGLDDGLRRELRDEARSAGLFAPQVARELGALGLDMRAMAVVFEEAGYSLLGPQALNSAAPDEGNMHLLAAVATPGQRERYLAPLAAGDTRSCFAMTEPAPGAGSDPSMLATPTDEPAASPTTVQTRRRTHIRLAGCDGDGSRQGRRRARSPPLSLT